MPGWRDGARLLIVVVAAAASAATTNKPSPRPPQVANSCGALTVRLVDWTDERMTIEIYPVDRRCDSRVAGARFVIRPVTNVIEGELQAAPRGGTTLRFARVPRAGDVFLELQLATGDAWQLTLRKGSLLDPRRIAPFIAAPTADQQPTPR